PVRRQVYTRRKGPLRYWLLSHTYLGVIAGIMILLHGGTSAGGLLTFGLMLSFDLVILTGLLGIALYFISPRLLTRIEGAPLLIDDLKQRRQELQKELADLGSSPSEPLRMLVRQKVLPRFVSVGFLLRQYSRREALEAMLESATEEFKDDLSRLSDAKDVT